ncbi:hypothetical protein B0J11DRAFT_473541 [Dendryphion nanum]|uniref:Uncharacterized protein n=1 Tax=Dendryphion nanum TaxID=256645 RepID=A0A9P9D1S5_9PLEO|nr:hypothetical protein B0J11DRAFT_473541 [Dendryphion nanum]
MQRARFLDTDQRHVAERSIKYRGTASIKLNVLHFPCEESRQLDEKNVERLRNLFREEGGCRRLDLRNHVPAIISQSQLNAAMAASRISAGQLLEDARDGYPKLDFPPGYRLECLHGRHRILAAAQVLPREDRHINQELKTTLIEEYSAEKEPDDGEIYSKIREYQGHRGAANPCFEKRWWARLAAISNHKKENLERILRHTDYKTAFDIQLDVPGLAGGMRLSTTHTMFAMRCHEPILHYLDDTIRDFWTKKIFCGDREAMRKVDRATVKALELTAPGACRTDFKALIGKVRRGQILGAFSEGDREAIWSRVLSATIDRLVPSLFSFFEDLNYLRIIADSVKQLFPPLPHGTVSSAIEDAFSDTNHRAGQCVIQESESSDVFRFGSLADRVDLGARQIWMFAMRNYHQMPAVPKRKKFSTKSVIGKGDETILCEFASFAYRLGYESESIHSLTQRSVDREIARSALLKARKPDRYKYNEAMFEDYVGQIARLFSEAQPTTVEQGSIAVEMDCSDGPPRRSGIPFAQDHERDRLSLFIDKLHNTNEEQCGEMSSFFIRRSVYFAFFGKPTCPTPRSVEEVPLSDTPFSVLVGDDQTREAQERLAQHEQERFAREEQARFVQEEQERQEQLAREEQEQLVRTEQERRIREQEIFAREEQERLAIEEQERLVRVQQEQLAKEEQKRLVRDEQERQERAVREEQARLIWEERLIREEQERLSREEKERLAKEKQDQFAKEEQDRAEQEQLVRREQERAAREEQERLVENLAKQWEDRTEQKKLDRNRSDKGPNVRKNPNAVRKGLRASVLAKRRKRPLTQLDLKKINDSGSLEANYRFVSPLQASDLLVEATGNQVEADNASHYLQLSSNSSAVYNSTASDKPPQLASGSGESSRAVEMPARDKLGKTTLEEEKRVVREEQEQIAHDYQEKPGAEEQEGRATREKERLVRDIAKQWEERLGQKISGEKTQHQSQPRVVENGAQRGIGAAKKNRPLTQFALETLRNAESQECTHESLSPQTTVRNEYQATTVREVVQNPTRSTQHGMDSSATDSSNPISASGKIPDHVTDSGEQIREIEPQITRRTTNQGSDLQPVRIEYKIRDHGVWRVSHTLLVHPSDPSEVKRVAIKYMRKRIQIFDTSFRMLTPQTCFENVTADGTNTILLIPDWDIDTDNRPTSVSKEHSDLRTTSEVNHSLLEPIPEDESEGEKNILKRIARRDSR